VKNNKLSFTVISLFFLVHFVLIFLLNYTTDAGDSIMHYLFSRWTFKHPENLVDHWAKPLFVLVSCPFAALGAFKGISLFNLLVYTAALIYMHFFCLRLGIKRSAIPVLMMAVFVFSNQIVHSGLTEPLGCLCMIAAFYYFTAKRFALGTLIISFSPFIRSEGLILCGIAGLFLLAVREIKWIPLLIVGHLVYTLFGVLFFHKTFLWVFTEIPYGHGASYGHGPWDHFVDNLPRTIGEVPAWFWKLGVLTLLLWPFLKPKPIDMDRFQKTAFWVLVIACFAAFFGFHTVAWAKGLFASFGLLRVMVVIFPQFAIICSLPVLYLLSLTEKRRWNPGLAWLFIAFILAGNCFGRFGYFAKHTFELDSAQVAAQNAHDYIVEHYPDYPHRQIVYAARYLAFLFDFDPFDPQKTKSFIDFAQNPAATPKGSLLVWDEWFAVHENGMPYEKLKNDSTLKFVKDYYVADDQTEGKFAIFEKVK